MVSGRVSCKFESRIPSALLENCAGAEPRRIQTVTRIACTLLVIDILRHAVHESPGGACGRFKRCTTAVTFEKIEHCLEAALVHLGIVRGLGSRVGEETLEEPLGLGLAYLAVRQLVHVGHEAIPRRDGNAELFLHRARIELATVRDLDGAAVAAQRDLQRVVAHHAYRGELCRGGQRAVAGRGQQQVAADLVTALECGRLSRARERQSLRPSFSTPAVSSW